MISIEHLKASRVSNNARKFYERVGAICNGYLLYGGIIKNEEQAMLVLKKAEGILMLPTES